MADEIRMKIEIRADEARLGPGRIFGTIMRYGERATDRAEVFEPGSLKWPDAGVVLNRQHSRAAPILRFVPQVEGNEVQLDVEIPDSSAGRDAAVEIRSGLFKGLSIEFRAVRQTIVSGIRRIAEATLTGAAIVDAGSYEAATVEVRTKAGGNRPNEATLWL